MNRNNQVGTDKLIVANCSGFFGDRLSAAKEMVQGGPIDVLTGDYLAELTMAILFGKQMKNPDKGYAETFLVQMKEVMLECLEKNIKIVSNAGGLNPKGLAIELTKLAEEFGLSKKIKIAYIEGDNLMGRLDTLTAEGESFAHLDTGEILADAVGSPVSANAYTGCWGIVKALENGADIVVGGRLADAALIAGPAAWKFGWKRDDWDRLAGAYVAGHVIECGTQATGGNYSFIDEIPSFENMGYPMAEIHSDGSCVITKHPGTGGIVSVGTITAQLLYEIRQPQYLTPDVTAHFETIQISQAADDRVLLTGIKGSPPPVTAKVCINIMTGYRNTMTVLLTGLDIEKKAKIVEDALFGAMGGKKVFTDVSVRLIASSKENPETNEEAFAYLRISVMDPNPKIAGKLFSSRLVEIALANIAGFNLTAPPGKPAMAIRHWPTLVDSRHVVQQVCIGDERLVVEATKGQANISGIFPPEKVITAATSLKEGTPVTAPLGRLFATRSGDKGGNANLGIWACDDLAYGFLQDFMTTEKLKELLPDLAGYQMERYEIPNLKALNFYILGMLGDGVANSGRLDAQAKTLGEYLRTKIISVPEILSGQLKI